MYISEGETPDRKISLAEILMQAKQEKEKEYYAIQHLEDLQLSQTNNGKALVFDLDENIKQIQQNAPLQRTQSEWLKNFGSSFQKSITRQLQNQSADLALKQFLRDDAIMEKEIEAFHQDVNTFEKVGRTSNNRILKMIVDENERYIFTVEFSIEDSCIYASKYDIKLQKSLKSFKIGTLENSNFQSVRVTLKQVDVQMSYSTKYFDLAIVIRINGQLQLFVIETDKFVKKTVKTLQATKESLLVNQNSVIGCRHITLQGHQEVLYIIHANEFEFFSWQYKKPDQYKDDQIFQQKNILDLRSKGKRVKQLSMKWCRIERFFDHKNCLDQDIQGIDQLLQNQNSVIICFINNIYINLNDLSCNDLPLAEDDLIDSLKVVKISNEYIALSQYFRNSKQTRLSLLQYKIKIQSVSNRQQKVVKFIQNQGQVDNQVTMMDGQRLIEPTFYFDLNQETIHLHYSSSYNGCTYAVDTKTGMFKSKRARNIEGKHYYSNQSESLLLLVNEFDDRIRVKKSYIHNFFLEKTEPNYQQLIVRGQNKQTPQEYGKYHFICDTFENTMIRVLGDNQIGISHGDDQISLKQPPIQVPQGDIEALKFDREGLPWVLVKTKNTGNIYSLFTMRQDGEHRVYLQHEHFFEVQDEIVHGCMFINGYQGIFLATHKGAIVQVDFTQIQFSKGHQEFKKVETLYCNEQDFKFKHGVKDFQMSKDLDFAFMSGYDLSEHFYVDLRTNQQRQIADKLELYSILVEPTTAFESNKSIIHHMRFSRIHENILYLIVSSWNGQKNEYKLFKKDLNSSKKAKLCYSFEVNALFQHTEVIRSIDCEEVNQGSNLVINVNQLLTSTQDVSVQEYHCVLHVVDIVNIKQDEIDRAKHLITINSQYNSASTYKILSASKDNFVLIQRYQDAPLQKILQFSLQDCPEIKKDKDSNSSKVKQNFAMSEFEKIVNVHLAMQGLRSIKDFNLITLNVLQKIRSPKQDMMPEIEIDSDQGQLIINYQAWDRKFDNDHEWLKKTQFQVKYLPQKQTMQMFEVLKEFYNVTQKVEKIDRSNKVKRNNIFNDVGTMINDENRDFIYKPLLQIGGRNMVHILGNYPKALQFIFQNYDEKKDGCIVHYDLTQTSPIDICLMNDSKIAAKDIQESLNLILRHMVAYMNDSDYSYLVNRKIKQLVDLNVESIVDVLNSEICTLKLTTKYLNRPCIMKHQEEAKSITWQETKKFHSQTYAKTFGEPLIDLKEYEAQKNKKGFMGTKKDNKWEENVQYETFAVEEIMDLDLMESILNSDMKNRFMFNCKPIQRMFTYKWSMIENNMKYNFWCFLMLFISLLINVYTLDLSNLTDSNNDIYSTPYRLWVNVGFNVIASLILIYLIYIEGFIKGANWIIAFTYWSAVLYQYAWPEWYVWIYSMYGLMFLKLGIKLADYLQLSRGNKLAQDVIYKSISNIIPILNHYLIFSLATGMMFYCFQSSYDCDSLNDVEPNYLKDILYFSFYIYSEMNECKPTINLQGDFMIEGENFPDYQDIYAGFVIFFINFYVIVMVMLFFNYFIAVLTSHQLDFKTNKEREYIQQKWEGIIEFWKKFHVGKGWETYSGLKFNPENLIFRFRQMTNQEKIRDDKHRNNGLLVDLDVDIKNYIYLNTIELKKDMDVRNNRTMNQILEKLDFKLEKISLQFDHRNNQPFDMLSSQQDSRPQSLGNGSENDMRASSNNQSSPNKQYR